MEMVGNAENWCRQQTDYKKSESKKQQYAPAGLLADSRSRFGKEIRRTLAGREIGRRNSRFRR